MIFSNIFYELVNFFLLLTLLLNLVLAVGIYLKGRSLVANKLFALLLIFISLWITGMLFFRISVDARYLSFWLNSYYFFAALVAFTFYFFCRGFKYKYRKVHIYEQFAHFSLLVIFLAVGHRGVVTEIIYRVDGNHMVTFNLFVYTLYICFFICYVATGFGNLLTKFHQSSGHLKQLIGIVLVATLIAALAGVVFDLLVPLYTYSYIWIGPYFTSAMVMIIARFVFFKKG